MPLLKDLFERFEYKYLVASAFVFGLFMTLLDTTIVNVALPRLGTEFHAGTDRLEWVVTGYLVSLAVWILASGWLGDRFGTKKTFLFATAMFTLGSALCGRAWSIESLAFFRVLQGIGGGMMSPVGTAMLFRVFSVHERARASSILGIPTQLAPMLGPLLGGFLVDRVSWRWIFDVNVPVGALSFLFAAKALREHREERAGGFDPSGFVLSGVGLAAVLYALSRGPDDGWTAANVLVTGLLGLSCLVGLVLVEKRLSAPMLDLALFGGRIFRTANLAAFCTFSAQNGVLFLLPLFLQGPRGLSAFDSGLITSAQPLGTIAMVQVTSRLYARIGPRPNLIVSTCGIIVTAFLLTRVGLETNLWWIRGIMLLRGVFIAFNMVSMQTIAFATISHEKMGRASSLFSTQRQVASAFGVAALGTVLISSSAAAPGASVRSAAAQLVTVQSFHIAFAASGLLGIMALLFALQIRKQDVIAPQSMRSTQKGLGESSPALPLH